MIMKKLTETNKHGIDYTFKRFSLKDNRTLDVYSSGTTTSPDDLTGGGLHCNASRTYIRLDNSNWECPLINWRKEFKDLIVE